MTTVRRATVLCVLAVLAGCDGSSRESGDNGAKDVGGPETPGFVGFDVREPARDVKVVAFDVPEDVRPSDVSGAPYTPCLRNEDCLSGFCVATGDGNVCTETCIQSCRDGWRCANVAAPPDILYVCVPLFPYLCHPCLSSEECSGLGTTGNLCVAYRTEGYFCGGACVADADCPGGYVCEERPVLEGGTAHQCVLARELCACTPSAVGKGTVCFRESQWGRCEVERECSAAGLTPCVAPTPAVETCNEKDDDCDGVTDDDCDGDGVPPEGDLCPTVYNPGQEDNDGDNVGDACDGDDDDDSYADLEDCAPFEHAIHPDAPELCDGRDNDCDGGIDEGLCNDDDACTDDRCDAQGICVFVPNEQPCDDGHFCTLDDTCQVGGCRGTPRDCDDANPCTLDGCDDILGCTHQELTGACEDGDPCTMGEVCIEGECLGGVPRDCNDNDPCTRDFCDPVEGCVHSSQNPCDDGSPCTDDRCEPGEGCVHTPNSATCDDGSRCTTRDVCVQGFCVGTVPLDCDDGDACTFDICNPGEGCTHAPAEGPCEDGNPCTSGEACRDGFCQGGHPTDCNDGDPCTEDTCLPATGCLHIGTNPCNDGNPCTADVCDPVAGCRYEPQPGACNDNNPCTEGDHCEAGACVAANPKNCDDGNPCTDDLCSAQAGCVKAPNAGPCDDGNPCTDGDHCQNSFCVGGAPATCDDGDVCTLDSCVPGAGCRHSPHNPCNDGNPCTVDACTPGVGCTTTPATGLCDDNDACTLGDHCEGGRCVGAAGQSCDDGNPCTADACLPGGICNHVNQTGTSCEDGNFCTTGDTCQSGRCRAGGPVSCNDGNPCTSDSCSQTAGCVYDGRPMNGASCDDDDNCFVGDTCGGGTCNSGSISYCGQSNNCPGFIWIGTCLALGDMPVCLGACF